MQLRWAHIRWNKPLGEKGLQWLEKHPEFEWPGSSAAKAEAAARSQQQAAASCRSQPKWDGRQRSQQQVTNWQLKQGGTDWTSWDGQQSWQVQKHGTWNDWSDGQLSTGGWDGHGGWGASTAEQWLASMVGSSVSNAMGVVLNPLMSRMDSMQAGLDILMTDEGAPSVLPQRRLLRWSKYSSHDQGAFCC